MVPCCIEQAACTECCLQLEPSLLALPSVTKIGYADNATASSPTNLAHRTHTQDLTTTLMTQHLRLSVHDSTLSTQGSLQKPISRRCGACSEWSSSAGVGVPVPGAAGGAPGGVAEQQRHFSSRCQQQQRQLEWPLGTAAAAAWLAHAR